MQKLVVIIDKVKSLFEEGKLDEVPGYLESVLGAKVRDEYMLQIELKIIGGTLNSIGNSLRMLAHPNNKESLARTLLDDLITNFNNLNEQLKKLE